MGFDNPEHPCNKCSKPLDDCEKCPVTDKLYWWNGQQDSKSASPCYDCRLPTTACGDCDEQNKAWFAQQVSAKQDKKATTTTYQYPKCSHSDWVDVPGTDKRLFLGSSGVTVPIEVDVYVRLTTNEPDKPYVPDWLKSYLPETEDKEWLVSWEVRDGTAGPDELVEFCLNVIKAGLQLGFGCVGGHGRTGWLACRIIKALTTMTGDEAVGYLRKNYCEKAVETDSQAADLGMILEQGSYDARTSYNWWPVNVTNKTKE